MDKKQAPCRPAFVALVAMATLAALAEGCSCTDEASGCTSAADCGLGQECSPDGKCYTPATSTGTGGNGGTGGTAGGACPGGEECGIPPVCCTADEECVQLQCLPRCETERCGPNLTCCAEGEECVDEECLALCPSPQVRCGDTTIECCDGGDICYRDQCTTPGDSCVDFTDCDYATEYCEPTLGVCLPILSLPDCTYHPPVGTFAPNVEWAFGPTTAPYARDEGNTGFTDYCSGVGTAVPFTDSDESVVSVSLGGLTVPFFDGDRTEMWVSTNGWLTLQSGYAGGAAPVNTDLPDVTAPELIIAPYWDDLTNVTACTFVDLSSSQIVVQWNADVAGTTENISFQVVIDANGSANAGNVEMIYGILGSTQDGDGATVGMADSVTDRGIVHSFDRNGGVNTTDPVWFRYIPLRNHVDALTPPAVFDLDFDGRPEVILAAYDEPTTAYSTQPNQAPFGLYSGVVTILNGEDGTIQDRWEAADAYVGGGGALAIGDLDGDGDPEIVGVGQMTVGTGPSYVKVFGSDGQLKWVSNTDIGFAWNGWGGGVHIADLDADGTPEVFFGLRVWHLDFTSDPQGVLTQLPWSQPQESGYPTTTAADLDNDGNLELISDNSAWHHDGQNVWNRTDLTAYRFPSVADFDKDGMPEVALTADNSVIILNGFDGSTYWGPQTLTDSGGGPLNIGDFDNDGFPEIGTAGATKYVVLDLQCTGTPLPAECEAEGIRWTTASKDASSEVTGSSLFDFEGDGIAEVIYSDECFTRVYSGLDGTVRFETPNNTRTATEFPLVADVDGDNNAEIIIVANEYVLGCTTAPYNIGLLGTPWTDAGYPAPYCGTGICGTRGIKVYGDALDNWVPTRRVWSGHAYHITEIAGDGSIPTTEQKNWQTYNNFRMNAQGADVFFAPDLVATDLSIDESSCDAKLVLNATVDNEGALGVVAGVKVSFYKSDGVGGWTCLGTELTTDDLLPGASTVVSMDYDLQPGELDLTIDFRVVVDSDCAGVGDNNECENGGEANNEALGSGECDQTT
ncbi:MAG: VCBS repeat-containing protein [Deltaproteobacteria bacterium]|jgi:hypothetical protein|nr:VCBS repeat-containing protein [Deltaproteobacteria bacterium]MBW2530665.1 VCBS repeat-containing protein [Deltaproteobacteria bacterium]